MSEKEELEIYRDFMRKLSIRTSTQDNSGITECLERVRIWGYAHSNSTMDMEHDEKCRISSIRNLTK